MCVDGPGIDSKLGEILPARRDRPCGPLSPL